MSSIQHVDGEATADVDTSSPIEDAAGTEAGPAQLDERAFEALYARHQPRLVRYATRRGAADPEGVADLALFGWYRAYGRLRDRSEAALVGYTYRAAANFISSELRRTTLVPTEIDEDDFPTTPDPAEQVADAWLWDLVDQLSPLQREVILRRFRDDESSEAIADLLDRKPNAIYQIQHRALGRLLRLIVAGAVITALVVALIVVRSGWGIDTVDTSPAEQRSGQDDQPRPAEGSDRDPNDDEIETGLPPTTLTDPVASPPEGTPPLPPDTQANQRPGETTGNTQPPQATEAPTRTSTTGPPGPVPSTTTVPTPTPPTSIAPTTGPPIIEPPAPAPVCDLRARAGVRFSGNRGGYQSIRPYLWFDLKFNPSDLAPGLSPADFESVDISPVTDVMEALGGEITLASDRADGSEFKTFYLGNDVRFLGPENPLPAVDLTYRFAGTNYLVCVTTDYDYDPDV